MHLDGRTRPRLGTASSRLTRWLAVLIPFSIAGSIFGQGYLVPPQGFNGAPAIPAMGNVNPYSGQARGQVGNRTMQQINDAANGEVEGPAKQPNGDTQANGDISAETTDKGGAGSLLAGSTDNFLRWGATHVHLNVNYQFLYDAGIHSAPHVSANTFTHTFTPGINVAFGPHISFTYTPSLRVYTESDFHDTLDHALGLVAGTHLGDWTVGASGGLTITDEPLLETSSQTEQKSYSAGAFASYSFNDKVSLATTAGIDFLSVGGVNSTNVFVSQTNGVVSGLSDSKSYSASEWLNYEYNDKLATALGATIGYNEQRGGFKSIDQQFTGRIGWHPQTKLNISLTAGFDHQDFLGTTATDAWNPIYSVTLGYQLFEQTSLALYANRSVNASIFQNQLSEVTVVGAGIRQRVLGKVEVTAGFGYTTSEYKSAATADLASSRSDNGTSFSFGFGFPFLTRCNFAMLYQYSQNNSTQGGFGSSSSQVGATLSWIY